MTQLFSTLIGAASAAWALVAGGRATNLWLNQPVVHNTNRDPDSLVRGVYVLCNAHHGFTFPGRAHDPFPLHLGLKKPDSVALQRRRVRIP